MENNKPILTDSVIARNEAIQKGSITSGLPRYARNDAKRCLFGFLLLLGLQFFAVSCRFNHQVKEEKTEVDNLMRYAHNVIVSEKDYGYLMEVICPWDTTLSLGKFAMVKDTTKAVDTDVKGILRVPVKSVVSFSATQWAVFLRLGEIDRVKGILEGRFVTDSTMRALLAEEKVYDIGTEAAADIERMIQIKPDALLYSPYFDGNQGGLNVTGAVLFPFADYMENTPLGRAEWIRVIGIMAGCEDKADAWFDDIERRYNALSGLCAGVEHRPTVFSDLAFNGQWYVAGGRSYIAKLFADAGADYIWKDNPSTASVPMDAESILAKAQHADYWRVINSNPFPMTYESLSKESPVYPLFDAYKNRQIIVCDILSTGYFEQSQCEPDLLLADFIHFFHPELLTGEWEGYRTKYYHLVGE
ncbi:MAG: ABC transporter substrate-binding protein [Bacteroidales bacterium]|nr:ABC transporter substrate-binding protein [Bacteroidales bacterium]